MDKDNVYFEVYTYLNYLGSDYIKRIPDSLWATIKNGAETFIKNHPGKNINSASLKTDGKKVLSKDARTMIFYLDYSFFAESKEEKQELVNILNQNKQEMKATELFKTMSAKEKIDNETLDNMHKRVMLLKKYMDDSSQSR